MQKETSNKIVELDHQQQELVDSLKLDYRVMLEYINKLVGPAKEKALIAGR